jgi:hypothetical protein
MLPQVARQIAPKVALFPLPGSLSRFESLSLRASSKQMGRSSLTIERPILANTGGERGIRTLGTCYSTHDFQSCNVNHFGINITESRNQVTKWKP